MITAGILYPGDMGTALARLLLASGHRVVTTLEGRSSLTAMRCAASGILVLDSLLDVVTRSDMLISSVPPQAAADVAERVSAAALTNGVRPLFVDTNSISPVTMRGIVRAFEGTGVMVVDASIHGLADQLEERATLYLSGSRAVTVAGVFGSHLHTVILGSDVGQASLFKMLMGGTSKGMVALMLELSDLALREGVLNAFWAECRRWYPSVSEQFERVLPSYQRHINRRVEEMHELALTVSSAGMEPTMATAVGDLLTRTAASPRTLHALVDVNGSRSPEGLSSDSG